MIDEKKIGGMSKDRPDITRIVHMISVAAIILTLLK